MIFNFCVSVFFPCHVRHELGHAGDNTLIRKIALWVKNTHSTHILQLNKLCTTQLGINLRHPNITQVAAKIL